MLSTLSYTDNDKYALVGLYQVLQLTVGTENMSLWLHSMEQQERYEQCEAIKIAMDRNNDKDYIEPKPMPFIDAINYIEKALNRSHAL